MKSTVLLLVSFIFSTTCFSQENILSTIDNIVYANSENSIFINLPKKACKDLILKTDNGKFQKEGCLLEYTPDYPGIAKFEIFKIKNGKKEKIRESVFRVRPLKDPIAHFAGQDGGNMNLERAKANQGLICYIPEVSCSPNISVDSYSIIIVKNNGSVVTTVNKGAKFDSTASALIRHLERGDQLIFSKIVTHTPDNVQRSAKPIEFSIN